MSDFLKRSIWYLEDSSEVDMELLMYPDDLQLHINIDEEQKEYDEYSKIIYWRKGMYIALNDKISFKLSFHLNDINDIKLHFYEDVNWKLTKIEEGVLAVLASNWIDEESILSALRSNLENPRIIDTSISIVSAKVQEVLEETSSEL